MELYQLKWAITGKIKIHLFPTSLTKPNVLYLKEFVLETQ